MSRVPAGLPTNPRARLARSQTPEIPRRQPEQPPRSLRSASSTRTRAAPAVRDRVQDTAQRVYQSRPPVDETRRVRRSGGSASTTSSSSSGSSFWERGPTSSRSSTTTLPSNEDVGYKEVGRGEVMKDESTSVSYTDTGFVWTRVTEAASALTQEVSKVWANGMAAAPLGYGAENEMEDESHLTKVMRAYHLARARTPAELPEWLFSERERGLKGSVAHPERPNNRGQEVPSPAQPAQRRNRPDNYHSDRSTAPDRSTEKPFRGGSLTEETPARTASGTDRLKMMRDLKRNATTVRGPEYRNHI